MCRDSDVLFSASGIGLLPSRFFYLNKDAEEMAAQQKKSEDDFDASCNSWRMKTNEVLKVSVVFYTLSYSTGGAGKESQESVCLVYGSRLRLTYAPST